MNYKITGKHINLTPTLKEYVYEVLESSEKLYENIIDVWVILARDHHMCVAEAVMHIGGEKLFVKSENDDMYAAIADMGDRLAHNLQRIKEKRSKIDHTSIKYLHEAVEN